MEKDTFHEGVFRFSNTFGFGIVYIGFITCVFDSNKLTYNSNWFFL